MERGKFITFEGGDGAGKSTQISLLAEHLKREGIPVLTTREPGGSPGAEEIRTLLLTGDKNRWSAVSEALMFAAARHDHLRQVIRPALEKGQWVLCDRFSDSTMAYQGIAGGLDKTLIKDIDFFATEGFSPDLTIILDLPVAEGLKRSGARNHQDGSDEDRFEKKGEAFHEKLRQAFLEIARQNSERCFVVDAAGSEEAVAKKVWAAVCERFGL